MTVLVAEPLARHTALRTGGPCGAWVVVRDDDELVTVVKDCRRVDWKVRVLGAGTRVIARDGRHPGAVVRLAGTFEEIGTAATWEVGAAVLLPALVTLAQQTGRTGLERFSLVPGTLGASVLHDEGWESIVASVYVLSRDTRREMSLADARKKAPIVLGARLNLASDEPSRIAARMGEHWSHLRPVPPGSLYRHAHARPKESVREVLASVRLPMVRLRQVAVPAVAPELLCNLGAGTAADLHLLHRSALERVAKVRGIELETRIEWIGED